jgi:hypothetical protein
VHLLLDIELQKSLEECVEKQLKTKKLIF